MLTAYRRASNIVRIEENKDGTIYDGEADGRLLEAQQEIELYRRLARARADISGALEGERFGEAMAALAGLRAPVDAFFDHVTVNCREFRPSGQPAAPALADPFGARGGSGLLTNRRVGSKAMTKWVYTFGDGKAEGGAKDKNLLGGKGANLAEMSSLGIPVPAGFTISTEVCTYYYENDNTYPPDLKEQVAAGLARSREDHGRQVRRDRGAAAAGLGALRRARLDARHDGHRSEPRTQRPDGAEPGEADRRRALRLRQLSAVHSDVLRRRDGRGQGEVRAPFGAAQGRGRQALRRRAHSG